ncbi:uncharacterized protein [Rutidosis leptorrhynchoides]|uniref:uncharacterized protein isoform X2 n=1 Tax=Rutidosis leptorrhynchoides TaxID=125765 RepID=UPI003A9A34C1
MDTRYKEVFSSWLEQSEDQFLVINGMPGSGKSTLAQYIVYSYGQHYESNSIVEKIGSRCKKMAILQQQLYNDISKGSDRRIHNVCQGTAHIEVLLEKTKALIVLDDVVKVRQLEDLLGSGNLNKESKIIITTDNDLSNWFRSKSKRYHKHKMSLLDNNEALELLSLHAFQSKNPKDGYEELAQQVVEYCEGNPLALEVLGSSLSQKRSMAAWESELRSFGKDFNGDIDVVLKSSYDSLTDSEKELFLHIACFFVGQDMDYVVNVLEPDYYAESKIKTLKKRCFLYVTPGKKLMMHRLLQEMGRSLVYRESPRILSKRSRVWRNKDSYEILRKKKGSETIEGLALDIKMLMIEEGLERRNLRELFSDSLQQMDKLKLLKLNYVELTGSYGDVSEHLRWLCWVGFNKSTIHTDLLMGKLVALDMSYSCLKVFEPPMVLGSLKILNLKDSHYLLEIRSIDQIPNLETLILWNCQSLFHVDSYIENLERLSVLNMTGCKNLCKKEPVHTSVQFNASTSGAGSTQRPSFPLPHFLHRLFLDECNLECTDRFPLSFNDQESLQYINLGNGLFEVLPSYNCLGNLRVLELRNCSRLKRLLCLPNALAELYISYCMSIEKITFESGRFTLQEFGYEGCFNLCEIEGLLKLLLVAKLDETDLGHMNWLKEYENHEVCLVGDYGLTEGRSCFLQMLYEYDIMSTSLPDIKHPNLVPEYATQSTSVSFNVPPCPISSHLQGLNVILRYKVSDEEDWTWFAKISMTNGDDLIYNPTVFGRPASGEVCIWLSYWPIGNLLNVGDEVTVSIFVMNGLEVVECGASLVYTDDDVASEISDNKLGWVETVERDLSEFKLRKGLYYLCRLDLYKLTELGRLTPGWLGTIVGDAIDDTEVRGWRMAGRPRQLYQSFTELKTIRCISQYPETKEPVLKNKAFELPEHLKISLEDIILATQNFSDASIIGRGGFGIVYKGLLFLANGSKVMIAAKRLDRKYGQGENEFFTELKILLLGYKHENVIELVGVCDESDEKIIVYEYAPRGSLDRHLNNVDLTWMKRLQICIEVASGLEFFHGSQELVILGDIKSTNILLMEDWKAKLTDFGISVISSINKETDYAIHGVRGTNGYIDPQSMESGFITKESDIYSFGVVLLEIFSGRLAVQKIGEQFHTVVLKHHYENGRSDEMVFEGIKKQIVPSSLATFLAIAFQCLNEKREQRPTARDVVIQLKKALDLQVLSF